MAQSAATTLLFTALTAYVALAAPVDYRSIPTPDDASEVTQVAAQAELAAIAVLNAYFPSTDRMASATPQAFVPRDIPVIWVPVNGTDGLVIPTALYYYFLDTNIEAMLPGDVAITSIPVDGTDHGLVMPTAVYETLMHHSDTPVTFIPVAGTDGLVMPSAVYYYFLETDLAAILPGNVAVIHLPVEGTDHGLVMPTKLYHALMGDINTNATQLYVPADLAPNPALPAGYVDPVIAQGGHYGAPVPGMPGVYTIVSADGMAVTCSAC